VVIGAESAVGFKDGGRDQQTFVRRDTIAGNSEYAVTTVSAKWKVFL
jgi:hypothetical protein